MDQKDLQETRSGLISNSPSPKSTTVHEKHNKRRRSKRGRRLSVFDNGSDAAGSGSFSSNLSVDAKHEIKKEGNEQTLLLMKERKQHLIEWRTKLSIEKEKWEALLKKFQDSTCTEESLESTFVTSKTMNWIRKKYFPLRLGLSPIETSLMMFSSFQKNAEIQKERMTSLESDIANGEAELSELYEMIEAQSEILNLLNEESLSLELEKCNAMIEDSKKWCAGGSFAVEFDKIASDFVYI